MKPRTLIFTSLIVLLCGVSIGFSEPVNAVKRLRSALQPRSQHTAWPEWLAFKAAFMSQDGRIVDHSQAHLPTVSEGQAYALFFALVANDQPAFEKLLRWTENNLAEGDLKTHLPAWLWGQQSEKWTVLDSNSASDADLWMVYTLLQAARLWCQPNYQHTAESLAKLILERETFNVQGLGLSLLPGAHGFVSTNGDVRLNPSYAPSFILENLATQWPNTPQWAELYLSNHRLLLASATTGSQPDWVVVHQGQVRPYEADPLGNFDAIRVYLWQGISPPNSSLLAVQLARQHAFLNEVQQRSGVPENAAYPEGGFSTNLGPAGFQIALAPLMKQLGHHTLSQHLQQQSIRSKQAEDWRAYGYYNSVLTLFAQGFLDQYYTIGPQGDLKPKAASEVNCAPH